MRILFTVMSTTAVLVAVFGVLSTVMAQEILYKDSFDDPSFTKAHFVPNERVYGQGVLERQEPSWDGISIMERSLVLDLGQNKNSRLNLTSRFDHVRNYRIQMKMSFEEVYRTDMQLGLLFTQDDPVQVDYLDQDYRYIYLSPPDKLFYESTSPIPERLLLDHRLFGMSKEFDVDLVVREEDGSLRGELRFDKETYVLDNMFPLSFLTVCVQGVKGVVRDLVITEFSQEGDPIGKTDWKKAVEVFPVWVFAQKEREFSLILDIVNASDNAIEDVSVSIVSADGIEILRNQPRTQSLQGRQSERLKWTGVAEQIGPKNVVFRIARRDDTFDIDMRLEIYPESIIEVSDPIQSAPIIVEDSQSIVLQNEKVRVTFIKGINGFGPQLISCRNVQNEWLNMAVIPHMGRLIAGRKEHEVQIAADEYKVYGDGITFFSSVKDGVDTKWDISIDFRLPVGSDMVSVKYCAIPESDTQLYLFEGPCVLAGEGSFGATKEFAVFPGLELLQGDQESSSTKDFGEPMNWRMAPHPYKITVPVMSVSTGEASIGLLWDTLQKWDESNSYVGAMFASPNRRMRQQVWPWGGENHLLGLFIPSVTEWITENTLMPGKPYMATAGNMLHINARILASSTTDPMYALKRWIDEHGLIEPAPLPRSLEEEVALSEYAYLYTLWDDVQKGWRQNLEIPGEQQLSSPPLCLYLGSLIVEDHELRHDYSQRLHDVIPRKTGLISSSMDPGSSIYPFFLGGLDDFGLNDLFLRAAAACSQQQKDGSWRYRELPLPDVGKKWGALGEDGMESVYHTSSNAKLVLQYARMTGDECFKSAGLRALDYLLATELKVPQGAPFEDPAASPYLLSVAYAVDAFLEGYQITLDEIYLFEARSWAWKGIPFVYLWNLPDTFLQRYATIGVFGSSYYKHSTWLGRPVQWIGLEYAKSLFDLWEYDKSFCWSTVAKGITVSAMYQQYDEGHAKGTYPDWVDGAGEIYYPGFDLRGGTSVQPDLILTNVFRLLALDPRVFSKQVQLNDDTLVVNAPVRISDVRVHDRQLTMELESNWSFTVYLFVVGGEEPTQVISNSSILPRVKQLGWIVDDKPETWSYSAAYGELSLRVTLERGSNTVILSF